MGNKVKWDKNPKNDYSDGYNAGRRYNKKVIKENTMFPAKVRSALYAVSAVLSPIVFYLGEQDRLDTFWVGLFSVVVTAVTALAFKNVTPDEK